MASACTWESIRRKKSVYGPAGQAARSACPGFSVPLNVTTDRVEALKLWSAVGVLAVLRGGRGVVGQWEAWRCQWAAAERTQGFRNHWQVYRGLVPADAAFSDLKFRESFLSLEELNKPLCVCVLWSKTTAGDKRTEHWKCLIIHQHSCNINNNVHYHENCSPEMTYDVYLYCIVFIVIVWQYFVISWQKELFPMTCSLHFLSVLYRQQAYSVSSSSFYSTSTCRWSRNKSPEVVHVHNSAHLNVYFAFTHGRNPNTRFSGKSLKASMETTTCISTPPSYLTIISGSFPVIICDSVSNLFFFFFFFNLLQDILIQFTCHFWYTPISWNITEPVFGDVLMSDLLVWQKHKCFYTVN